MSRAAQRCTWWLALALAGCQTAESPQPVAPESPAEQTSPGKVSAPVEITYELLSEPRLGQPLTIRLNTRALRPDQTVALQVGSADGLTVTGETVLAPQRLPLEEPRADQVIVTPMAQGRSFLNVLATVTLNGAQMHKAISIPIDVGPVAQPDVETQVDAAGTPIRSMPAQETTVD